MSGLETLGEAARQEPCHLAGSEAGGLGQLDLGQDLFGLKLGPHRRKEAVDDQMRQSMHQAPRRHGRKIVVERTLVEVGDAAQQYSFDACGRASSAGYFARSARTARTSGERGRGSGERTRYRQDPPG